MEGKGKYRHGDGEGGMKLKREMARDSFIAP